MQKINENEWISECGEFTVFTNGIVRVYQNEEIIDFTKINLPVEVEEFLNCFM
jgi:hypothetical protein